MQQMFFSWHRPNIVNGWIGRLGHTRDKRRAAIRLHTDGRSVEDIGAEVLRLIQPDIASQADRR